MEARMRHRAKSSCTLLAASFCTTLACAADPGDPLKTSAAYRGGRDSGSSDGEASFNGSSTGSSGGTVSSSSSGSSTASSFSSGGGPNDASGEASANSDSSVASIDATGETGAILPEGGASCITANCPLKVQWKTSMMQANTIGPYVNLVNTGPMAIDLASVKVHYYYTADGDTSSVFACDYAGYYNSAMTGFSGADVMGSFVPLGTNATPYADTFLDISFSSINLPANMTVSVNFRIHSMNYSINYDQANDWSNLSPTNSTNYVDAPYITAYLGGVLAWGMEPGAPPQDASHPPEAGASDVSAN
jgi:Cellulose binding domain